jgi:hypothetical protein
MITDRTHDVILALPNGLAARVTMRRSDPSEYYLAVETALIRSTRSETDAYVRWFTLYEDQQIRGIPYTSALAGPDGMDFTLIVFPDMPEETVRLAKAQLRREQDVVQLRVVRIKAWLDFKLPPRPLYKLQQRGAVGWGDLKASINDGPYAVELFTSWSEAETERQQNPDPETIRVVTAETAADHDFYT